MSSPQLSAAGRRHALLLARARRLASPRTRLQKLNAIACLVCESGQDLCALPLTRIARVAFPSFVQRACQHATRRLSG